MSLNPIWHRWIYLAGLALVAIGLPFSKAFMSIGEMVLAVNFLLEGRLGQRFRELLSKPTALLFLGVFVLHAVGLLWTTDFEYALEDLRVKLPLLIFPIIIPLSYKLRRTEFLWIAALFCASVVINSFLSTYNYYTHLHDPGFDFRKISMFTSHIRFSLMVCMAYLILLNCAWNEEKTLSYKIFYIALAAWLSVFVFLLQSMTGVVLWLVSSYCLLLYSTLYMRKAMSRTIGLAALVIAPMLVGVYLWKQIDDFYPDQLPDMSTFDTQTENGVFYGHDSTNLMLENGNLIYSYVALEELRQEWAKKSDLAFADGKDDKGQFVSSTLIRYLSSKGLRKDSAGIAQLSEKDIEAIESGIANVRYLEPDPIGNRVYTIIWEYEKMKYERNAEGHSVAQRLVYWTAGWEIFKSNPVIGVGTGDVSNAFNQEYEEMNTPMKERFRLRAHNQFLTIALTFGMLGFLLFFASVVMPFFTLKSANSFLYLGFFIIAMGSMLNEDTLETQAGVTFYAFFNAFLLYSLRSSTSSEEESTSA